MQYKKGFFRKKVEMDVKDGATLRIDSLRDSRGQGIKDSSGMIKALIKLLGNKLLNPRILES